MDVTAASGTFRLTLADPAASESLAARLAPLLRPGDVVALRGELGVGKTTIARALIRALTAGGEEVPSPTFTLAQMYEARDFDIWHFDLYRLEKPEDAFELGIEDAMAESVCLIEWPERLGRYLPADCLDLHLEFANGENQRVVSLGGGGGWPQRLAEVAGG